MMTITIMMIINTAAELAPIKITECIGKWFHDGGSSNIAPSLIVVLSLWDCDSKIIYKCMNDSQTVSGDRV